MPAKNLTAKQDRSRESVKRLLRAATEVLAEKGLKGATIPKIAARAGLSPGAVYRRFPDKDALLKAVFIAVLESNDAGTARLLDSDRATRMDLAEFAEYTISISIEGQRMYSGLLRALSEYSRTVTDARFKKKCDELQIRTFQRVSEFLSQKAGAIDHPDPAAAFRFALMLVGFTLGEIFVRNDFSKSWAPLLPKDDETLKRELTRALLAYLNAGGDLKRTRATAKTRGSARS